MASRTQEEILKYFREASGSGALSGSEADGIAIQAQSSLPGALQEATKAVQGLAGATRTQESAITVVAQALSPGSGTGQSGESTTAAKISSAVLKSGLGFAPLVQGIVRLFGGGGEAEPPALPRYQAPQSVRVEAALRDGVMTEMDYDQSGRIRVPTRQRPLPPQESQPGGAPDSSREKFASGAPPTATVNVNVQAMDSRSFLDHSHDIACAVRDAMLNLNSINDVVNDL